MRRLGGQFKALPSLAALGRRALARWDDLGFLLIAAVVAAWITRDAFGARVASFSPTSDYWEHSAVLRALMLDPLHPEHPHVAGTHWSPRFSPQFLVVALVGRVFGLDALGAAGVSASLNACLFFAGIYLFFREYFRTSLASLLGLFVMLASWIEGPHFSNVYQLWVLFSVASYPSTAALGITLVGFWLTLCTLRGERESRGALAVLVLLFAWLYLTHPLTAMLGFAGTTLLSLFEPGVAWRRRLLVAGTVPLGLILSLFWPYYPAISLVAGGTAERVQQGLESGRAVPASVHPFYESDTLVNMIGLAALGALPFPYFIWKRLHLFVVLGFLAMLLPFLVTMLVDLPLGHRFILLAVFFLQVGLVWLLLELLPAAQALKQGPRRALAALRVAAVVTLLGGATVWNVELALEKVEARADRTSPVVRYARRVSKLAGKDAIVMARPVTAWSLPAFGPRIIELEHGNPLLSDGAERARAVRRFYSPSTSDHEREEILERYRVTHVIAERPRDRALERFLASRADPEPLPRGHRLYVLSTPRAR